MLKVTLTIIALWCVMSYQRLEKLEMISKLLNQETNVILIIVYELCPESYLMGCKTL